MAIALAKRRRRPKQASFFVEACRAEMTCTAVAPSIALRRADAS